MRIDGDDLIMDDGKVYYANNGIVGLSPEGNIHGGYDDTIHLVDHDDGVAMDYALVIPKAHRREIAEYMIRQWVNVLEQASEGEPFSSFLCAPIRGVRDYVIGRCQAIFDAASRRED